MTITATADAIAGAADLVKGKAQGLPIAVIRGLGHLVHDEPRPVSAADLLRPHEEDMFHTGAAESWAAGRAEGFDEGYAAALREHGIEP